MSNKGALPKSSSKASKTNSPCNHDVSRCSTQLKEMELDDEAGLELKPKPKVTNIPEACGKNGTANKVDSCKLKNSEDVNVVYKRHKMQNSSLSVLFIGSSGNLRAKKKDDGPD